MLEIFSNVQDAMQELKELQMDMEIGTRYWELAEP